MAEGFDDVQARDAWDMGAEAWEAFVSSGADYYRTEVHGPALLAACGQVEGLRVLDLGCGQGYFSRKLAERGARVVGVDLSERLTDFARRHEAENPLGIAYHSMSAQDVGAHWPPGSFDMATACMALQDMADVAATLRSTHEILRYDEHATTRDEGNTSKHTDRRFVFSVPHPCTDMPTREWEKDAEGNKLMLKVDRYFDSGPGVCAWTMARLRYAWETPYWRYTLGEWSDLLIASGFLIRRLIEPRPTAAQVARNPKLDDCMRLPYFLIFDTIAR